MSPIFLCYAPVDGQAAATRLRAELEHFGFEVWRNIEAIQGEKTWKEQLREALRNVNEVVVVLTPGAMASQMVEWTWETALTLQKQVISLLILPCEVPDELQVLPYHDLSTEQSYGLGLAGLIRDLNQFKTAEASQPAPNSAPSGASSITISGNANNSTMITGHNNVVGSNNVTQSGKYNVNIASAKDLQIGNTYYSNPPSKPADNTDRASAGRASADRASAIRQKTILVLAANPSDSERLSLDREVREIEEGLRRSKHRDLFKVEQRWAVRTQDLRRALLDLEPEIVHFCGHGTNHGTNVSSSDSATWGGATDARKLSVISDATDEGGLVLEDETGKAQLVKGQALTDLFSLFQGRLECVVLNSCYSETQAALIVQQVPIVIGMKRAIGDRAAIEFSRGFYDALGAGRTIEEAFRFGCNAIDLQRIPEHLTPVIQHRHR